MIVTAAQAIKRECRDCISKAQTECITKVCQLHPDVWEGKRSKVKQIKAHCLECAGTVQAVKGCSGKLTPGKGNDGACWLHPFRMGKNPHRAKSTSRPLTGIARIASERSKRGGKIDFKGRG